MPLPDIVAHTDCGYNGLAEVCCAVGEVQWCTDDGAIVELPTMADIEHIANQAPGARLEREDGRPIITGRDTPSNEQLAIAEASGELCVPDVFGGELIQPHEGRRFVDVDTKGRV